MPVLALQTVQTKCFCVLSERKKCENLRSLDFRDSRFLNLFWKVSLAISVLIHCDNHYIVIGSLRVIKIIILWFRVEEGGLICARGRRAARGLVSFIIILIFIIGFNHQYNLDFYHLYNLDFNHQQNLDFYHQFNLDFNHQ